VPTFFISDIHLSPERPGIAEVFLKFIAETAPQASALYILGDLFDYWIGDEDADEPFNASALAAMRALGTRGCALHLMHGNRDFLLSAAIAQRIGATLLGESAVIDLEGRPTLVMHGDTLCIDDHDYQKFRAMVRTPGWQAKTLAKPLAVRRGMLAALRSQNADSKSAKSEIIMDVNAGAVERALAESGCDRLIHGHTHRPDRHALVVGGRTCERWVLADWYERGSYLACDPQGCRSIVLEGTPLAQSTASE